MKIWDKIKIGVGALAVITLGATGLYWTQERRGYENNVHIFNERLDRVVYAGDGGIKTPQRDAVEKEIRRYAPKKFRELGDPAYPDGLINEKTFKEHVSEPFGELGPQHDETLLIGGNHQAYSLKKSERDFLFEKFKDGPVGKIRFDNYYGLHVYYNACEVYWESTVYDVKVGDPPMQKRQEAFVCKAVKDPRCAGKLMIGLTHQADIGAGPRGDTKSDDYEKFGKRCLHETLDYVLSGHEHLTMFSGQRKRARYFISGALAKWTPWAAAVKNPAFLSLDDETIRIREVETKPTIAAEDDE